VIPVHFLPKGVERLAQLLFGQELISENEVSGTGVYFRLFHQHPARRKRANFNRIFALGHPELEIAALGGVMRLHESWTNCFAVAGYFLEAVAALLQARKIWPRDYQDELAICCRDPVSRACLTRSLAETDSGSGDGFAIRISNGSTEACG